MSDVLNHPLVRAFLASVERETAVLSADRRRELTADLREHIESVLPEGADDPAVRQALDRLGTPGEIAAAAIADDPEANSLRPEGGSRTRLTLGMMAVAAPLWVVAIGLVLSVLAIVRIGRSTAWTRRDKRQGIVCALSPLLVIPAAVALFSGAGRLGAAEVIAILVLAMVVPLAGAVRLGRRAARPLAA